MFKGANIGDEAIIGANSIVTGEIPANTLAIGSPARVVRERVTWDINLIPEDGSEHIPQVRMTEPVQLPPYSEASGRVEDAVLAEANYRTEAVQIVLTAVLASRNWRGFDRRKFMRLITEASSAIPNDGPAAVQHAVLLAETRKVLWLAR